MTMFGINYKMGDQSIMEVTVLWYKGWENCISFKSPSDETADGMRLWNLYPFCN